MWSKSIIVLAIWTQTHFSSWKTYFFIPFLNSDFCHEKVVWWGFFGGFFFWGGVVGWFCVVLVFVWFCVFWFLCGGFFVIFFCNYVIYFIWVFQKIKIIFKCLKFLRHYLSGGRGKRKKKQQSNKKNKLKPTTNKQTRKKPKPNQKKQKTPKQDKAFLD